MKSVTPSKSPSVAAIIILEFLSFPIYLFFCSFAFACTCAIAFAFTEKLGPTLFLLSWPFVSLVPLAAGLLVVPLASFLFCAGVTAFEEVPAGVVAFAGEASGVATFAGEAAGVVAFVAAVEVVAFVGEVAGVVAFAGEAVGVVT